MQPPQRAMERQRGGSHGCLPFLFPDIMSAVIHRSFGTTRRILHVPHSFFASIRLAGNEFCGRCLILRAEAALI